MIPSEIIDIAVQQTNIKLSDIGDGDAVVGLQRAYSYLNIVKDSLWNNIVWSSTGRNISWQKWTNDLIALQSEYALPQVVSDENRIKKIESLGITYTGTVYSRTGKIIYNPARLVDPASLPNDWYWYEENQPTTDPVYYVSDKSIFVAPVCSTTIADALQLTWVQKIQDYDEFTTEQGMVIPDDMHYLLITGLREQIYLKKWAPQNAQALKKEYKQDVKDTLDVERDYKVWPHFASYPDGWVAGLYGKMWEWNYFWLPPQ